MKKAHPTDQDLARWALAKLPPPRGVRGHLEECEACRSKAVQMRRLQETLTAPAAEASLSAKSRVYALLPPPVPRGKTLTAFRRAIMGQASPRLAVAGGLRGEFGVRTYVLESKESEVHLRVEGSGLGTSASLGGLVVRKRASAAGAASGTAWLRVRAEEPRFSPVLRSGEFLFPAPPAKPWILLLDWAGERTRIDSGDLTP